NDGRVVSNFIVQALLGKDLTIYGDGSQTRSFQYVDDLLEGMIRMMHTPKDFTGPINLGNQNEFSMIELAEHIIDLTGSSSGLLFRPLPKDDPKMRQPNTTLAKSRLDGWECSIQLREGLERTIAYFETNLKKATTTKRVVRV
ncbi:MAG: NAD-dependent epimerase/dehydratase family protein, partial [Gramella sp.]|nr:NAD-dependent epimerase/dehydratase family protein [Christiangramia sp.]